MNLGKRAHSLTSVFTAAAVGVFLAACGNDVVLGTQSKDGGANGTGGALGGSGGKQSDAALGTVGAQGGSGGTLAADAPISTGGAGNGTVEIEGHAYKDDKDRPDTNFERLSI